LLKQLLSSISHKKEGVAMSQFIGNFHKSLPHDKFGEVKDKSYKEFESICNKIEAGIRPAIDFEKVDKGPRKHSAQSDFVDGVDPKLIKNVARLTSPLAAAATEAHGPDPKALNMCPPPDIRSLSALAEMVELYWMALLRDVPLLAFQEHGGIADAGVNNAVQAVKTLFDAALQHDTDPGKLITPCDLTVKDDDVDIRLQTLFRTGLQGEEFGPLVSQFFVRPIGYGVQTIDQQIVPYIAGQDFLTTHGDWLLAQNTGKDKYGRDYSKCNNYADQMKHGVNYYPCNSAGKPVKRYISTMRDLARFVNRDALHQAYFNAALFLLGIDAPRDKGNPYHKDECKKRYKREDGFATLGDPDLLTLVSEVASRALKVVWRQKWLIHRRCRPEVFGGLLQMQLNGYTNQQGRCERRSYGLLEGLDPQVDAAVQKTLDAVSQHNEGTLFLPMAFSAGSPNHPAYGAGHATVAGACVTILKAWFDEDAKLKELFDNAKTPKDPPLEEKLTLLQPGHRCSGDDLEIFSKPQEYCGKDADCMTIGGELNKMASNVAMGRSMGGVHWRSDNTRSLRLGEDIAIEILRKRTLEYAEKPVSFTFRSFDRKEVRISDGRVERCD
jgi:hypothetical protein